MKKIWAFAAAAVLGAAVLLSGCGSSTSSNTKLVVGASPVPHAEILEQVKPILAKEGIDLEIKEFTDYVTPNTALDEKAIDANFFQTVPYMNNFVKDHPMDIVFVGGVHIEPIGLYSHKVKSISEIANGSKIAIPNDPTNGGRGLLLLQKAGLIQLKDGGSDKSTVQDIIANPKNLQIVELEAAQLPRSLDDVEAAVINVNYALEAKLDPSKDALILEDKDSPYVNGIVVRKGDENRPEIKKLVETLQTPEIKQFIQEKYHGAVVPGF